MMIFRILILFLMVTIKVTVVISTHPFHGKILPHAKTSTTQIFRPNNKLIYPLVRPPARQDLPKIIFFKHLLELKCIKEMYNPNRIKNVSGYPKVRPQQTFALRNDDGNKEMFHTNITKINQIKIESGSKINNTENKQIQTPHSPKGETDNIRSSNVTYEVQESKINKAYHMEEGQKLNLSLEIRELLTNVSNNDSKEDKINPGDVSMTHPQVFSQEEEINNEKERNLSKFETENSTAVTENKDLSQMANLDNKKFSKFSQQPSKVNISFFPNSTSYRLWHLKKPDQNQPYKVKEVIEENPSLDLSFNKDENLNSGETLDGSLQEEMANIEEEKKEPQHPPRVIDKSISAILKGLIGPMLGKNPSLLETRESFTEPSRKKHLENIWNPQEGSIKGFPARNNKFQFVPPKGKNSNHHILESNAKPSNRHGNHRSFNPELSQSFPEMFFNREKHTTENENNKNNISIKEATKRVTEIQENSEQTIFTPSVFPKSQTNFHFSDLIQNSKLKTIIPKKISVTLVDPTERYRNSNLPNFFKNSKKFTESKEIHSSAPAIVITTEKIFRTIHMTENEISSNLSSLKTIANFTSSEIKYKIVPTPELLSINNLSKAELTRTKFSGDLTNTSKLELSTTQNFKETTKHLSEANAQNPELTTQYFKEFYNNPVSAVLLTTTKSDSLKVAAQEANWKSSRKMHFNQEAPKFSKTINDLETEQRRSDILISDNLEDYTDSQNQLTALNYLENLKRSGSNLTSGSSVNLTLTESIIPLIPVVINDLREGRISSNDTEILSEIFGKYFPYIIALSNNTSLDLLPLLKMKNENDLEDIMQHFILEYSNKTTSNTVLEKSERDRYNTMYDNQNYYYLEEYKDLYKDILGQELNEERKTFRLKRNEDDDAKRLEATREYFESLGEEQSEERTDYIFEDVMYDDLLESYDPSVFEQMEVSKLYLNTRNMTSREKQK